MLVEVWGEWQGPPKANRLRGGAEVEVGSSGGGEIRIKPRARPSEAPLCRFVLSSHLADEETEAL